MGDVDDLVVLRSGDEDALAEEIMMRSEVVTQGEVEKFAHGDDSKHHGRGERMGEQAHSGRVCAREKNVAPVPKPNIFHVFGLPGGT